MAEVFVSTLKYCEYLEQERAIQKGKEERKELTNPNPDDVPENLVDLGVVVGSLSNEKSIAQDILKMALSNLRQEASGMGAEFVFNLSLRVPTNGCNYTQGVPIYMGEAYKRREHR